MKHQAKSKTGYAIPLVLSFLCIAIFGVSASSGLSSKDSQATILSMSRPAVSVETQADSPLRVSQINTDSLTAYIPEVELTLTNVSTYPISAYAVRFDVLGEKWQKGGVDLSNAISVQAIFQPGQFKQVTLGDGVRYSDPIKVIKIIIDFVEFTDGVTWGPDGFQSGEKLAGMRVGARAALKLFNKVLKSGGPVAVISSIESNAADVIPPSNRSPEWVNGFQLGVSAVRERLRHSYIDHGSTQIETEIRRPFDASGWRRVQ
ncbi:MAG TPA: hypothetical protein VJ464_18805 [Blastocatellia bacterium]|nr:hypothetical protein [Blastocatellia bacterium]